MSNYMIGETTTVFVNPNDPSQAFFKRDTEGWCKTIEPYALMLWGGLMMVTGVGAIVSKLAKLVGNSSRLPL